MYIPLVKLQVWCKDLIVYLNYFQILIKNINLLNLSKDFKKLHIQPSFSFNIKEIFISNVKSDQDLTPKNKAQIINLLTKFSTIFACFEELIKQIGILKKKKI
jgi:hypothetical protein